MLAYSLDEDESQLVQFAAQRGMAFCVWGVVQQPTIGLKAVI
jgi:hypothetical protein